MRLTTREITMGGVLGAITIILGFTYLGYITVPTPAGAATLMHIPVIISGIVLGAKVGALVGTIFGLSAIYYFSSIAPIWVLFPARPLIGVFAALSFQFMYKLLKRERERSLPYSSILLSLIFFLMFLWIFRNYNKYLSSVLSFVLAAIIFYTLFKTDPLISSMTFASIIGSITNTVITLGLAVVFKIFNLQQAVTIGIVQGIPEAIVAVVLCVPISIFLKRFVEKRKVSEEA
ncbi:MAG: ECF transporter S component [Caldiserica bacterium]|nr:MAG: ECF transporter S component [Caldisericota bacterium]